MLYDLNSYFFYLVFGIASSVKGENIDQSQVVMRVESYHQLLMPCPEARSEEDEAIKCHAFVS